MDKLPKDIVLKLTEELSPQDFVSFCASNTSQNVVRACNSEELWNKRLMKDFPYIFVPVLQQKLNKKELYLGVFTRMSKVSEELTQEVLNGYGPAMERFLKPDFKKFLYDNFYKFLNQILQYTITKGDYKDEENDGWPYKDVSEIYYGDEFTDFRNFYFPGGRDDEDDYEMFVNYWDLRIKYPIYEFVKEMVKFLQEY